MSRAAPPVSWRPGEPVSSEKLNRMLNESIREITVGPGMGLVRTPGGRVALTLQERNAPAPRPGIVVKVTATKGTGGQYDGTVMSGTLTPDGTGTYALPGALTAGTSVLVVNDDEYGNSTHWVELNSYAEGVYDGGQSTEGTPRPVVRIQRAKYRTGSPQTFGSSAERTTAATDTWNRAAATAGTDYGDKPIELWVCTGVFYDSAAGSPALTALMRKLTLAADGRGHALSAETTYVIDTPDTTCP